MSIKKMFDRVDLTAPVSAVPHAGRGPLTTPGKLMQFSSELEDARRKLADYDNSLPTKRLDPKRIRPSKLRNRHEDSFHGEVWDQFKAEIESAGGNVQAIKVRPVSGDPHHDYEVVFGHRRHRASLETDTQVVAVIEEVNDRDLYEAMTRENVGRNDLTPWEWGQHYRRGLDAGLYATQAQLAAANRMSAAHVSTCLRLVDEVPEPAIRAFVSPLQIEWRWAEKLVAIAKTDAQGLRERAEPLVGKAMPARRVFEALMTTADSTKVLAKTWELTGKGGRKCGTLQIAARKVSITLTKDAVPTSRMAALRKLLGDFLAEDERSAAEE